MHRFIPSPEEPAPSIAATRAEHAEAIRRWTRAYLRLDDDSVVTVTEHGCADPGCPILETAISVFGPQETRTWKFQRPSVAVTKLMVQQTLATPPQVTPRLPAT